MRIAVDGLGGDHAPDEVVRGSVLAVRELGVHVVLTGPSTRLRGLISRSGGDTRVEFAEASETVAMDEHAAVAARHKRDSSIAVGLGLVKAGEAQAFVSAGNTGAVMATALLVLGRQPGIERPAIAVPFPTITGRPALLLDAGANADAKPEYLLQFARMGVEYSRLVLKVSRPRVGLLNIGEESSKGSQLAREAHALLERAAEGFVGNVEGKDIYRGAADVVVTDGFSGNVFIKSAEGAAEMIRTSIRSAIKGRPDFMLGGLLIRPAMKRVQRRLDYAEYGGAPLLGVNGTVVIAHGRSNARAIRNAIRAARDAATGRVEAPSTVSG